MLVGHFPGRFKFKLFAKNRLRDYGLLRLHDLRDGIELLQEAFSYQVLGFVEQSNHSLRNETVVGWRRVRQV